MSNARLKVVVAVLLGVLAATSAYGMWEWGRDKNYWGTPDDVAALWDLSIVQAAEELPGGIVDRGQRPNAEFMSKPEPAYIEFSVIDEADDGNAEQLKKLAEEQGWDIEEKCAQGVDWCAQIVDDQGFQLLMTVSRELERAGDSKEGVGQKLRVKVFYI